MDKPEHKYVAIVSFNSMENIAPRTTYFQVTINPDHVSPDGLYIRFGDISGDEITGWVELEELDVHSILYEYKNSEKLHYTGQDVGIQMLGRLNGQKRLEVA